MFYLVYVSSAVELLATPVLMNILELARENNLRRGVTGMLLYKGGNFMQVLEGEEPTVLELFDKISRDPRHKGIITMLTGYQEHREFPNWSMAFYNLHDPDLAAIPGYSKFLNTPLNSEDFTANSQYLWELLRIFKANIR